MLASSFRYNSSNFSTVNLFKVDLTERSITMRVDSPSCCRRWRAAAQEVGEALSSGGDGAGAAVGAAKDGTADAIAVGALKVPLDGSDRGGVGGAPRGCEVCSAAIASFAGGGSSTEPMAHQRKRNSMSREATGELKGFVSFELETGIVSSSTQAPLLGSVRSQSLSSARVEPPSPMGSASSPQSSAVFSETTFFALSSSGGDGVAAMRHAVFIMTEVLTFEIGFHTIWRRVVEGAMDLG
mmetsp:Transcript_150607/g.419819  ORF Transcript_150607/g.419819 Transcript_150607/m.419819 type:complete len:240 (+) Transcript_150607:1119-1838(+)